MGLQKAYGILGIVLPPVHASGLLGRWSIVVVIRLEVLVLGPGSFQIAGQDVEQQAVVGGTLHIALAAKRVHAASGHADVAQQELDHGHGPDVLGAHGVLGPAHGVHDGGRLALCPGGRVGLVDLNQFFLRRSRDRGYCVKVIARGVLLQELKYAVGVHEAQVALDNA